jgi:(2Fe-2S) ferredoxin
VYPGAVLYGNVTDADVDSIIEQHIIGGVPVAAKQLPAEVW